MRPFLAITAGLLVTTIVAAGVTLAILAMLNGGRLPEVLRRDANLQDEDDPANIPPRVYLSVLTGAILIAAVICFLALRH